MKKIVLLIALTLATTGFAAEQKVDTETTDTKTEQSKTKKTKESPFLVRNLDKIKKASYFIDGIQLPLLCILAYNYKELYPSKQTGSSSSEFSTTKIVKGNNVQTTTKTDIKKFQFNAALYPLSLISIATTFTSLTLHFLAKKGSDQKQKYELEKLQKKIDRLKQEALLAKS